MDDVLADIAAQLEEFCLSADEKVLSKMKQLGFVYKLAAEDIVHQWVAFCMSHNTKTCVSPTLPLLEQMEKEELMKPKTTKSRKSASSAITPVYNSSNIDLISNNNYELPIKDNRSHLQNLDRSPIFSPKSMTPTSYTPSRKYSSRSGAGNVVCSFGETQNVEWKYSHEFSCSISAHDSKTALLNSYHFMCEKLGVRASILNDMILEAAEYFKSENNVEEWGPIHLPSMEPVSVIGLVCSDSGGKLNSASLVLQGSLEHSSGQAVPLDVSRLENFSFFPGQIIAGTGINSTGKKFVMHSLYEGVCPPICPKAPDLANCIDSLGVVVAAGPFATSDTFSFEPLWDLLKYVKSAVPHVLILIGPFIDMKNNFVKNELSETFENVFKKLFPEILKYIENLNTKVVLVPSTRDAHHDFIYPTPPFTVDFSTKRLYLASDPCILNIEGVVFAITSTDILFHLGKEEISHPQLPDRLGRLCGHLLTQRNFYPLCPTNEEVNIDYLHYEQHAGIPVMPHVLIVPSDFRYFIKDVHGCCCINPERLTKHSTGGTFARLKISCNKGQEYKGSVINSIKAEVLKI